MAEPIFTSTIFVNYILPFLFVFTVIFAVLEKTKLLGEDKKQIDAIVALVVGLFIIAFPYPRNIIVSLMPFLAVLIAILLVFMLLYGFIGGKTEGDVLDKGVKIVLSILVAISVVIFLVWVTGAWEFLRARLSGEFGEQFWSNVIFAIIILGVILAVLLPGKKAEK